MKTIMLQGTPPRISLIGFMGSGKSTVGRMLAGRLKYSFLDLDDLIEKNAGKSIRCIFTEHGETRFRKLETEALYSLIEKDKLVIAAGGGAAVQKQNHTFFQNNSFTVYLEVSFDEFLRRTARDPDRPLLKRAEKELRELYNARLPIYRELGRIVKTDGKAPRLIADEILTLLGPAC